MFSRTLYDPFFDPFFIPSSARAWGFSDPFEEIRRDPIFRQMLTASSPEEHLESGNTGAMVKKGDAKDKESKEMATKTDAQNWLAAYARAPTVDIIKRDKEYQINVDVPGVRKEDMKLSLNEDRRGRKTLTISGERKDEHAQEDKEKGYVQRSSMYGKFSRSLMLPDDADVKPESIQAKHDNGVLKITCPRLQEPAKPAGTEVKIQ